MSRRLSIQYKNPTKSKPKVKFPDELVFLESIKDNDIDHIRGMLRRASLEVDINKISNSGLTALHHAVLENSKDLVELLLENKAQINVLDEDSWTPLHAACAMGYYDLVKYLLENGADPHLVSREGERAIDLVEPKNLPLVSLLLNYMSHTPDSTDSLDNSKKNSLTNSSLLWDNYEKILNKIFKSANGTINSKTQQKTNQNIIDEILSSVKDKSQLNTKVFISCLTMLICESCMKDLYQNECKLNTELLTKKLSILKHFLNNDTELQLECLYSVQTLDFKYNHPNTKKYSKRALVTDNKAQCLG